MTRNRVSGAGASGFRLGAGAARNRFKKNVATASTNFGLDESDDAGVNRYATSNRFGRTHLRARR